MVGQAGQLREDAVSAEARVTELEEAARPFAEPRDTTLAEYHRSVLRSARTRVKQVENMARTIVTLQDEISELRTLYLELRTERDGYLGAVAAIEVWEAREQKQHERAKDAEAHVAALKNKLAVYGALCADYRSALLERDSYGDEMRMLQRRVIFLEGELASTQRTLQKALHNSGKIEAELREAKERG